MRYVRVTFAVEDKDQLQFGDEVDEWLEENPRVQGAYVQVYVTREEATVDPLSVVHDSGIELKADEAYDLWASLDYVRICYEGGLVGTDPEIMHTVDAKLMDTLFARARLCARTQNDLREQFNLKVDPR